MSGGDVVKQREEQFHDAWAESIDPADVLVDESWNAVTCPEHRWIRSQLGDIRGKRVLDLGCGAGEAAVWFAKQGADVVASDLSPRFLDLVQRVAQRHGVSVQTHLGDADSIALPDASFDIVYAGNLLHHVDVDRTLEQIARLLRPGGMVATWDPLRHNPVINVYRRMAKPVRTADEHPLSIGDVRKFDRWFGDVKYETFWLATLWIFLRFYLIERVHPSQERYWKKIIREHERLTPIYRRWERVDRFLLRDAVSQTVLLERRRLREEGGEVKFLSSPWLYYAVRQGMCGGLPFRQWVELYGLCDRTARVADIGCGPADLLRFVRAESRPAFYLGVDVSRRYLDAARRRAERAGVVALFVEMDLERLGSDRAMQERLIALLNEHRISRVLLLGVIHHIDDDAVRTTLDLVHRAATVQSVVTQDVVFLPGMRINNFLAARDRGRHVRAEGGYDALMASSAWETREKFWTSPGLSGVKYLHYRLRRATAPAASTH